MCDSELPGTNPIDKRFEFMKLPYDLRYMVIKEMDLLSFIRLKKCSKSSLETCETCGFVPDLYVDEVSYNYYDTPGLVFDGPMHRDSPLEIDRIPNRCRIMVSSLKTEDFTEAACALFRGRDVLIRLLEIAGDITCSPQEFNAFLEDTQVDDLFFDGLTDIDVYNQPAMRELNNLWVRNEMHPPLPTETVLALRAPCIDLPSLHFEALRPLFDQWTRCLREIREVVFKRHVFAIRGGLEEPRMLLVLIYLKLVTGLEADFRIVEISVENLFFVARVTRADGKRVQIDVDVGADGSVTVEFYGY